MTSGLAERNGTLLAQHRAEPEQLVDQALERELAQLVEQRPAACIGFRETGQRRLPLEAADEFEARSTHTPHNPPT